MQLSCICAAPVTILSTSLRCVTLLPLLLACGAPRGNTPGQVGSTSGGSDAAEPTEAGGAGGAAGAGSAAGATASTGGAGGTDDDAAAGGAPLAGAPAAGAGGAAGGDTGVDCELSYSEGHGDLFVRFEGGLDLAVRSTFGSAPPEILAETSRVCVVVPPASRALVEAMGGAPDSDQFAFLGVSAGAPFWLLPATPREGVPWFGASTEDVPSGYYDGNELRLRIAALELPAGGQLAVWSTNTFGVPSVLFSTTTDVLTHAFPRGAHVHFNWAFSVAGTYAITFAVEAERAGTTEHMLAAPLRLLVQP